MGERLAVRASSMSAAVLVVAAAILAAVTMRIHMMEDQTGDTPIIPVIRPDPIPPKPLEPQKATPTPPIREAQPIHIDDTPPIAPPTPQPPTLTEDPIGGRSGPSITPADFGVLPDGSKFAIYYPRRALERGIQGRVQLTCSVNAQHRLASCVVLQEDPAGWGFGDASMRMAQREFRVNPQTVDGQPTDGGTITFPIRWRMPN